MRIIWIFSITSLSQIKENKGRVSGKRSLFEIGTVIVGLRLIVHRWHWHLNHWLLHLNHWLLHRHHWLLICHGHHARLVSHRLHLGTAESNRILKLM